MITAGSKILSRTAMVNRQFVRHLDSVKCGMPRNRISFGERVIHGIFISVGMLAIPAYIATNLKHYRGNEE
ncbi:hypothetical protein KQX54_005783 [Cotesia glomerata]|uniref:Cytochrome c oxidase polypeptide VIIc n=1 Tax=Cotesia glomerata TaxID=32391 RepID=A0AAV7I770_COTGL|nr:hypothetical protein KQX54_005783 [Cotesia glomerata]